MRTYGAVVGVRDSMIGKAPHLFRPLLSLRHHRTLRHLHHRLELQRPEIVFATVTVAKHLCTSRGVVRRIDKLKGHLLLQTPGPVLTVINGTYNEKDGWYKTANGYNDSGG